MDANTKNENTYDRSMSDDLMIALVKKRILEDDCRDGFLLDGFPRTIPQAEAMNDADILLDDVIEIKVPDAVIVDRLSGRRVHPGSGRTYHLTFCPPAVEGIDLRIFPSAYVQRLAKTD